MLELRLLNRLETPFERALFDRMCELYEASFPEDSEREPRSVWEDALQNDALNYRLEFVVAHEGERVVGGVVFEYYPASRCGLVTFVFVDARTRKRGLARSLMERAEARLLERSAGTIRVIFAEAEDPERVKALGIRTAIDPAIRLAILDRLGARRVRVPYIQPPLGPGKQPARHLYLLVLWPRDLEALPSDLLAEFLLDFYGSLIDDDSEKRQLVCDVIDGIGEMVAIDRLIERSHG